MAFRTNIVLTSDYVETYIVNIPTPEEKLLYAMLERALLDLTCTNSKYDRYKREAANWILYRGKEPYKTGISFKSVKDHLELRKELVARIEEIAMNVRYGKRKR